MAFCLLGFAGPVTVLAATTPSLGAAATYAVLSGTYTNTSAGTTINGDVGFTTPPAVIPLGVHTNYGSGAPYATAGIDQGSALSALASQSCTFTFAPGAIDLATDTTHGPIGLYAPGVYCTSGAVSIGTGGITLSGAGTYVFRIDGALTSVANSVVTLSGGASSCDVFWTPTQATTLGANSTFRGTIIDAAGITIGSTALLNGRALAFGGTVTTDADTITAPTCSVPPASVPSSATLHVVKQVVNNNGGTAPASLFNLHVKLSGTDVVGSPATGIASPGRSYTLAAGTYVVSEDISSGYTQSFSGACGSNGSVTLSAGADLTCTITNDDIAPVGVVLPSSITVVKTVINDNGRTRTVASFPLFVNGTPVTSGAVNSFPTGVYAVTETSDANYTRTFSGDCDINGVLNLVSGDNKTCRITNNDIASAIVPALPNTGFPPVSRIPWNVVIFSGVLLVAIPALYMTMLKKRTVR